MSMMVNPVIKSIVAAGQVKRVESDWYQVQAQSLNYESWYDVISVESGWACDCPHNQWMNIKCKHIQAVEYSLRVSTVVLSDHIDKRFCVYCKSGRTKKAGKRHNKYRDVQLYECKDCKRRFTHELNFAGCGDPKMITSALQLYFSGESLRGVQKYLKTQGVKISHVTVYNWIVKYTKLIDDYVSKLKPDVGSKWRADEVFMNIKGRRKYLYALMDDDTRFWISQQVSDTKYTEDVIPMFKKAKMATGKTPDRFITDGAFNFAEAYRSQFMASGTVHTRHIHMKGDKNNNMMERMNGEIRDREKVIRGIKKTDSSIFKGLQIYHNYCRSHMGLDGKTPADKAGIIIAGDDKWRTLIQNAGS